MESQTVSWLKSLSWSTGEELSLIEPDSTPYVTSWSDIIGMATGDKEPAAFQLRLPQWFMQLHCIKADQNVSYKKSFLRLINQSTKFRKQMEYGKIIQ